MAAASPPRTFCTEPDDYNSEYRNLRYTKRGPKGGIWEQAHVRMCGPPHQRQKGPDACWLCGSQLRAHKRTWTRPSWRRKVVTKYAPGTAPLGSGCASTLIAPSGRPLYDTVRREVKMPPSELSMHIFSCPRGCDDDEELRALLAAAEHSGPAMRPWRIS